MAEVAKPHWTKSDLVPRLVGAGVAIPLILALLFYAPNWAVGLALSVAAGIGAWEYLTMTGVRATPTLFAVGVLAPVATLLAAYWFPGTLAAYGVASLSAIAMMMSCLQMGDNPARAGRSIALSLSSFAYVTLLFGGLVLLSRGPVPGEIWTRQSGWMLFAMFIIFTGDTGAYFTGRLFGRHKLAPNVSPGKTIEGAIGGLVCSVGGGFVAVAMFAPTHLPALTAMQICLFAIPAALLGQVGDLCESLIKRSTGAKDSGNIIYGHGGMLDRLDALMFAAPYIVVLRAYLELGN
ncbi:MAG: phosphatidate cytidylyltransferase [Deltaproteobacteria bacterium]|nr:phosphatidate cytidylyltransferase [Deltaproteobacteria bacterium]